MVNNTLTPRPLQNIGGLDAYPNIESEISGFLGSLDECTSGAVTATTFCLLGPDALLSGRYESMLLTLEENGYSVRQAELFSVVSEQLLEELYKYHVPDAIKTSPPFEKLDCSMKRYCFFQKTVPTRNWRLLRKRFELGPSLAMIVGKEGANATEEIKRLKGPTDPLNTQKQHLRYYSDNPCMSAVHSSDDSASFVREGLLFFGESRLRTTLASGSVVAWDDVIRYTKASLPRSGEFRFLIVALLLRLRMVYKAQCWSRATQLAAFYEDSLERAHKISVGAELLKAFTSLLRDEQGLLREAISIFPEAPAWLLQTLSTKALFRKWPAEAFRSRLVEGGICLSDGEALILEAGLYYYRDV